MLTNSSLHRAASRKTTPHLHVSPTSLGRCRRGATSIPSSAARSGRIHAEPSIGPRDASTASRSTARSRVRIGREVRHMDTTTPKTIFITGATGLVGSHAVEEALAAGTASGPWSAPTSDTRWLDQWGVEKVAGDLEDAEALRARRRRGRLGLQLRGQGRRLGHARGVPPAQRRCPPAPARRRRATPGSSGSSMSARSASTRAATTTGPTRPSRPRPTRSTPTPAPRPRPRPWCSTYHKERGLPVGHRPPGLHLRRARPDRPAQAADQPAARDVRLLRLGRTGAQLHLRQEPGPRHLPRRREPGRRRRGLQPDRRRARQQEAVRRPRRRAGGAEAAHAAHPAVAGASSWPTLVEGIAKLRGAKNPPLINKARYKFLGLNLDYSIEKARRVLGYQPPYTLRRGDRAGHGRAPPPAHRGRPCRRRVAVPDYRRDSTCTNVIGNRSPRGAT